MCSKNALQGISQKPKVKVSRRTFWLTNLYVDKPFNLTQNICTISTSESLCNNNSRDTKVKNFTKYRHRYEYCTKLKKLHRLQRHLTYKIRNRKLKIYLWQCDIIYIIQTLECLNRHECVIGDVESVSLFEFVDQVVLVEI